MGNKWRLLITTTLGVAMMPGVGSAADLYTKAPMAPRPTYFSWTGFYVGDNVGYAFSANSGVDCTFTGSSPCAIGGAPNVAPSGWMAGVQAGYNWQMSTNFLVGLEADFAAMAVRDTGNFATTDPNYAGAQATSKFDWLGTARGRAGYLVDQRTLIYATGGFAYARLEQSYQDNSHGTTSWNGVRTGWTVGGGLEYAIDPHWSAKLEYMYVNLENTSLGVTFGSGANTSLEFPNDLHIVRAGLNYRF
jgi:outer membrane immunogenic protein